MKITGIAISAVIGITLAGGTALTVPNGISEEDLACYMKAARMQDSADEMGFEGFELADYKVAFNDGRHDYVMSPDGSSEKRSPVLTTFAATAFDNDGSFEVIVPTKDSMGLLSAMMGGEWNEASQAATIWHEAFHCYQLTNYRENVEGLTKGHVFSQNDFSERLINDQYSANQKAKELFAEQLEILEKARGENDIDKMREDMVKYKELDGQRTALISEDAQILEDYYTIVEGTAYYVEMNMLTAADGAEHFSGLTGFAEGSSKYYKLGGSQCLLLDKLDENWKTGYDFSVSPDELIYEKLGV